MYWREVVASLYPWDILDEGLEPILDTLERETRTNSTYLVALMHDEKRPLTDFYYPHNPRRKVYWTEDSRAYWTPHPDAYAESRIKPRTSDNPEIAGVDWLQVLVDGSRAWGMTVGAEPHTWLDMSAPPRVCRRRAARHLRAAVRPARSFNHPDVRLWGGPLHGPRRPL